MTHKVASEPGTLPWRMWGWVSEEPECDSCLGTSLERRQGTSTSQPIDEGKREARAVGPAR